MTKELIESIRRIILPFIAKKLKEIDYEGLGESDAKEFTQDFNEILNLAIKALEQQPCKDAISRQEVIETLKELDWRYNGHPGGEVYGAIYKLPPVQPKIKTGRWIYKKFNWYCSECNNTPKTLGYVGKAEFMKEHFRFCNHCGAMMLDAVMTEDEGKANESGQMQDL